MTPKLMFLPLLPLVFPKTGTLRSPDSQGVKVEFVLKIYHMPGPSSAERKGLTSSQMHLF